MIARVCVCGVRHVCRCPSFPQSVGSERRKAGLRRFANSRKTSRNSGLSLAAFWAICGGFAILFFGSATAAVETTGGARRAAVFFTLLNGSRRLLCVADRAPKIPH